MRYPSPTAALRSLGFLVLVASALPALANPWWMRGAPGEDRDFLAPDVAFQVAAHVEGPVFKVRWVIADGYYLYRSKMQISAESPDLIVEPPTLPKGSLLTDSYFGTQEVYFQQVDVTTAFHRIDAGAHPPQIKVTYQGCAQAGLCYPPISKVIFPDSPSVRDLPAPLAIPGSNVWLTGAIGGGCLAFLAAGLLLRKGRRLDMPSP
jgi:thiol:disulfide interchange protein DsbD